MGFKGENHKFNNPLSLIQGERHDIVTYTLYKVGPIFSKEEDILKELVIKSSMN